MGVLQGEPFVIMELAMLVLAEGIGKLRLVSDLSFSHESKSAFSQSVADDVPGSLAIVSFKIFI